MSKDCMAGISGTGMVSVLGNNISETVSNLYHSFPSLPALPVRVDTALLLPVFEVRGIDPEQGIPGGFTMQLLRIALVEALEEARISLQNLSRLRVGVCIGTTVACQLNDIPFYAALRSGGEAPSAPFRNYIEGCPAEWIRRKYALQGPALTVSNACSSGADAIGIGMTWIRNNVCDMVIAGGADELNKVPLDGFNALGVCSPEPCRPFDASRNGLNLGEAAGIVILENARLAEKRGAVQSFAAAGFGKSADAYHITQPDPSGDGLLRAISLCLNDAGADADDVNFVNAHGTGTLINDVVEAKTLSEIFGSQLKYMSTKSLTGHTLGAAGAIEFILTMLMMKEKSAVSSHRFEQLSEDIMYPPLTEITAVDGDFALSTSLAFGGSNSALAVRRLS